MKWLSMVSMGVLACFTHWSDAQVSNISTEVKSGGSNVDLLSAKIDALIIEDKETYNRLAYGDENNFEILCEVAKDSHSSYRVAAVIGLARLNSEQAADFLADIAQDNDRVVAGYALDALATMSAPLAVPRLINLLDSPSLYTYEKGLIITVLRKYPSAAVEMAIIHQSVEPELQNVALSSLAVIGTERSISLLKQFSQGESRNSKSIATYSLRQIEERICRGKTTGYSEGENETHTEK